jgi:hypothetical protein
LKEALGQYLRAFDRCLESAESAKLKEMRMKESEKDTASASSANRESLQESTKREKEIQPKEKSLKDSGSDKEGSKRVLKFKKEREEREKEKEAKEKEKLAKDKERKEEKEAKEKEKESAKDTEKEAKEKERQAKKDAGSSNRLRFLSSQKNEKEKQKDEKDTKEAKDKEKDKETKEKGKEPKEKEKDKDKKEEKGKVEKQEKLRGKKDSARREKDKLSKKQPKEEFQRQERQMETLFELKLQQEMRLMKELKLEKGARLKAEQQQQQLESNPQASTNVAAENTPGDAKESSPTSTGRRPFPARTSPAISPSTSPRQARSPTSPSARSPTVSPRSTSPRSPNQRTRTNTTTRETRDRNATARSERKSVNFALLPKRMLTSIDEVVAVEGVGLSADTDLKLEQLKSDVMAQTEQDGLFDTLRCADFTYFEFAEPSFDTSFLKEFDDEERANSRLILECDLQLLQSPTTPLRDRHRIVDNIRMSIKVSQLDHMMLDLMQNQNEDDQECAHVMTAPEPDDRLTNFKFDVHDLLGESMESEESDSESVDTKGYSNNLAHDGVLQKLLFFSICFFLIFFLFCFVSF